MHILVTTDTVGGVWTYTRELVAGLLQRGVRVTLVSFGNIPSDTQVHWMEEYQSLGNSNFDYRPTGFRLEWMHDAPEDMEASAEYLRNVVEETKPDLLHSNQFYYGALDCDVPRLVVAHSDVVSWWVAVHGQQPPQNPWLEWYRQSVTRGLARATAVVAPSQWMLGQIERHYLKLQHSCAIYNGRSPLLFNPHSRKDGHIVTVGRLWDLGKNVRLLVQTEMPAPVRVVGSDHHPDGRSNGLMAGARPNVFVQPLQGEKQIVQIFGRAAIYAATSQYEPFGLAPVEAALSRCAIVASDIPSFRELWGGAALFFRSNDTSDLRSALELLVREQAVRREYANLAYERARQRFTAARMVDEYLELYEALSSQHSAFSRRAVVLPYQPSDREGSSGAEC
ncbi:MAG TPA: glycosyltransferase family 4 protein [Candidatus Angelobacter sp.]|nr:glycosyltransferase family 4 protein [Candidatus Angelobacter sp.]